jgi:hypothetical protein
MSQKTRGILYGTAAVFSLGVILRLAQAFFRLPGADLISWDQAARAEEAVRLAKEFRFFEIPRFVVHILSLNWWPPLHPLLMFPFCLILGPSIEAAIIPSLAAFLLAVLAILFAYENLLPSSAQDKILGFSFLFTLTVTSPFLLSSATWAMLEIFGVGLTFLALGFYFRARRTGAIPAYKMCAILLFLLWSLKYSYGLFVTTVLIVAELARSGLALPRVRNLWRKPAFLFKLVGYPIYGLLGIVIWIACGGSLKGKFLGVVVSVSNIYNPLLYLYLYLLVIILWQAWKNRQKIKARLALGQKELLLWGALPLGIFLALPDKIKAVIKNFEAGQQPNSGVFPKQIFFYLRSIVEDYSLFVPVGILVLALFLFAIIRIRRTSPALRLLAAFFFLGYVALLLGFKFQESRYIAAFIPALWIGAAWSAETLTAKFSRPVKTILAGLLFGATLAIMFFSPLPFKKALTQPWATWAHHDVMLRPIVDSIVRTTESSPNLFITGVQDAGFSPLLGWRLQIAHFKQKEFRVDLDTSNDEKNNTAGLARMAAREGTDWIVLCIVRGGRSESLLLGWADRLRGSDRYLLNKEEAYDAPLPLKLLFYRKAAD